MTYRTRRIRLVRTLLVLLLSWALVPLVFFIPPHVPWALLAFVAGLYFAFRQWRGEYVVHDFSGRCPRCAEPLNIASGSAIRLPHTLTCFSCHHEPTLALDPQ